jgi:2-C-methyl-D-erythritol 4-phosphate cytidylyltransferase
MKVSAIIVAAGSGTRLGLSTAKAFVRLGDSSLLARSLHVLRAVGGAIDEVVIAVPSGMEQAARAETRAAGLEIPVKITAGGVERQDSVRIALALTGAEAEIVLVHDAARPFAMPAMFSACIETAARVGGAIAAVPLADTLKRVDGQSIKSTLTRAGLWQAQTPQAFRRAILLKAHDQALRDQVTATDDADLVERLGANVEVIEGSPLNLKITTPDDLIMAEAIAARIQAN